MCFIITPDLVNVGQYISHALRATGPALKVLGKARIYEGATEPTQEQMAALFVEVPVRRLSKLALRRQLRDIGKEDIFSGILANIPHAQTDWDDAPEILTSDPMFTTHAEAFKGLLGLTQEQFDALLNAAAI